MRKSAAAVTAVTLATALTAGAQAAVAAPTPPLGQSTPSPQDKPGIVKRALAAAAEHRQDLRGGAGQDFKAVDVLVDRDGTKHTRMDRTYKGMPVLGGDVVVHQGAGGDWRGASQTLAAEPQVNPTPKISAEDAKKVAGPKAGGAPKLVVEARGAAAGQPRLAWQVTQTGKQEGNAPSRVNVTVDAETGTVLLSEETIQTSVGDGVGKSLYSGSVPLKTQRTWPFYRLQDPTRGNTSTVEAWGGQDCPTDPATGEETNCGRSTPTTPFKDNDNWWGYGLLGGRQTAAVDAQYGTNEAWDYYKNVHGRVGIAGDGKGSVNRVHYGRGLNNAFWDPQNFRMTYGDGDNRHMGPVVSLDVAGHELSHGVTGTSAKLVYAGESGGLNEATSDIFGTMIEFYANNPNNVPNYLIGEKVMRDAPALRYMDKPSKDGKSVDYWSASTARLNPHYSSGVGNHFFYLLSEGSGAKTINGRSYDSPTANRATVTGIGRDNAAKIWYRALTTYMTSNTGYKDARVATVKAATDLFGANSAQVKGVGDAWSAVNVA